MDLAQAIRGALDPDSRAVRPALEELADLMAQAGHPVNPHSLWYHLRGKGRRTDAAPLWAKTDLLDGLAAVRDEHPAVIHNAQLVTHGKAPRWLPDLIRLVLDEVESIGTVFTPSPISSEDEDEMVARAVLGIVAPKFPPPKRVTAPLSSPSDTKTPRVGE